VTIEILDTNGTVIRSVAVPSSRWRKPDGQRRAA
jgi:hypothetical protein